MEEAHKAVLKRKRVHDDKIVPVPDEIRDHNTMGILVSLSQYKEVLRYLNMPLHSLDKRYQ